jgi:hypothetical protein
MYLILEAERITAIIVEIMSILAIGALMAK